MHWIFNRELPPLAQKGWNPGRFQFKRGCAKEGLQFLNPGLGLQAFEMIKPATLRMYMKMTAITNRPSTSEPIRAAEARGHLSKKRAWHLAAIQMAALLVMTVLFELYDVDRRVAGHFYRSADGWFLAHHPLWSWLYHYGTLPGLIVALAALVICLAGIWVGGLKPWRKPCLLVVLTTVIAAGLLVNAVLKQYWGRPRPSQTAEFGGNWTYRPIYSPGPPGQGASFPCGHCTMGFILISMAGFYRRSKALAAGGVAAGILLGVLLSAARIVQGAHFLSDAIWSMGIVAMTATLLYAYLGPFQAGDHAAVRQPVTPWRKFWLTTVTLAAVAIMAAAFMTRRPYYNTMVYPLNMEPAIREIDIRINADPERVVVRSADQDEARLQVDAHGFGWLKFDYHMGFGTRIQAKTLGITLQVQKHSYFAELDHTLTLTLPSRAGNLVKVKVNDRWVDGQRP
jgi:lipid A 4'-phosphatase